MPASSSAVPIQLSARTTGSRSPSPSASSNARLPHVSVPARSSAFSARGGVGVGHRQLVPGLKLLQHGERLGPRLLAVGDAAGAPQQPRERAQQRSLPAPVAAGAADD